MQIIIAIVFIVVLVMQAPFANADAKADVMETELAKKQSKNEAMVYIRAGSYIPLYKRDGQKKTIDIKAFYLDTYQVTNQDFAKFIKQHPKWSKSLIKPIFADENYLRHFTDEQTLADIAKQPVVNVSWFSAMAYCKAQGKRLPSVDEWEYVAQASATKANGVADAAYRQQILEWYSKPATAHLPNVTDSHKNYWGVYGMHGVVWELVRDFNGALVTGESRGDSALDNKLFCGAGAAASVDPSDYAAFMRYALRSSYSATYTISSLGFRCAKNE